MSSLNSLLAWIEDKRTTQASRLLKQNVQGRTLDVGCWNGCVARAITDDVVGIDVYLHPNPVIPVTKYDGRKFPFQDKEFDTVLCCGALHHAKV